MATRKVGGIVAELLLNDKDFVRKLNRAGKLTDSRMAQMKKAAVAASGAVLAAGAAVAAVGGVAAVGISRANTRLDQLAKTSDKLGIAPDKLEALRYAAEQSGIAIGVLDTATQRMVRRISEASLGGGPAADAIKELGLSAQELARLSPDKQMARIADAMKDVGNQGDVVRLAMKLFDTEGVALVNMLTNGSEGLEELTKELESFGVAVTRLDLAKIEEANNSFARLKRVKQGFWDQMAIQAAPVLEKIGDELLDLTLRFGGMDKVAETVMDNLLKGAGYVADSFNEWHTVYKAGELGLIGLERTAIAVSQSIVNAMEDAANMAIDSINLLIQAANRIPKVDIEKLAAFEMTVVNDFLSDRSDSAQRRFQDSLSELRALREGEKPSERMRTWFEGAHAAFEQRAKDRISTGIVDALDPLDDLGTAAEKAAKELEKLTVQDIADLDPTGSRGSLAQRILDLEEQAKREEAQGRDEAAERSRERAQGLRDRLDSLQSGGSQVQGDQGFQRRRDEMRERNFIGPRLPEGTEVEPEAAPEVRSGSKVDSEGGSKSGNGAIVERLDALISRFDMLAGNIGVV